MRQFIVALLLCPLVLAEPFLVIDMMRSVDPEARHGDRFDDFEDAKQLVQYDLQAVHDALATHDPEVEQHFARLERSLALFGEIGGYTKLKQIRNRNSDTYWALVHYTLWLQEYWLSLDEKNVMCYATVK